MYEDGSALAILGQFVQVDVNGLCVPAAFVVANDCLCVVGQQSILEDCVHEVFLQFKEATLCGASRNVFVVHDNC